MASSLFKPGIYLADGGFETSLIYLQGVTLNHFAAFEQLNDEQGRKALMDYYLPYMQVASQQGVRFILETPTWRSNPDWGQKLGYDINALNEINEDAVRFLRLLLQSAPLTEERILLSGAMGPRGDGYIAGTRMSISEARDYHSEQVQAFARQGIDVISAVTLTYSEEALGIVQAAKNASVPVVISFTTETDGSLPGGESLQEAITKVDDATGGYASHFMINCAHPSHFRHVLLDDGDWKSRIGGVRANASAKSHAELDASDTLDPGDRNALAQDYRELKQLLPGLRVIGGCCGTDHSHMEMICTEILD